MADKGAPKISQHEFTKIADKLLGSEGPVFDKDGNFYMVAPEVEKDGAFAGQILKVDLSTCKVCFRSLSFKHVPEKPDLFFGSTRYANIVTLH